VLGLFALLVLVRQISVAEFGEWALFLTLLTLADAIRNGVCQTALVRFAARSDTDTLNSVTGAAWVLALGVTACIAAISLLCGELAPKTPGIGLMAVWYPVIGLSSIPWSVAVWRLQAEERFGAILITRMALGSSFLILLVVVTPGDASSVAQLFGISAGLTTVLALASGWSKPQSLLKTDRRTLGRMIRFGRFTAGTQIGTDLLNSSDVFILGAMLGPEAVALYVLPQRIVQGFRILVQGLGFGLFPGLAHLGRTRRLSELRALLFRASGGLTAVLLPAVVVSCLAADPLLSVVGGTSYAGAVPVARLLLLGLLLMPVSQYFGMALDAIGRSDLNMKKVGIMLLANIIGDVLVLSLGGSTEAVAAVTLVTLSSGALLGFRFLNRFIGVRIADLARFTLEDGRTILTTLRSARTT
jgi:O-antigen/teichoic acid export membrane protein